MKIMDYFQGHPSVKIGLVVTNKADAGVIKLAETRNIPCVIISKSMLYDDKLFSICLDTYGINGIVLAGFLLLIPPYLIDTFPRKIVNIHPALLPKHGGKGMFGHHVHEAVKASGSTETGLTIHYCDKHYDEGHIIFQAKCPVLPTDSAEDIAAKVLFLEHLYYARVLEKVFTRAAN